MGLAKIQEDYTTTRGNSFKMKHLLKLNKKQVNGLETIFMSIFLPFSIIIFMGIFITFFLSIVENVVTPLIFSILLLLTILYGSFIVYIIQHLTYEILKVMRK